VAAKRHVEFTTFIEAAESVEAGPVQIVEELRGLRGLRLAIRDQSIETVAMPVETFLFVFHLDAY